MNEQKTNFIGIDISKKTLDVRVYAADNNRAENYIQVSNDSSGFASLLKWFKRKKMALSSILVCMEHTGMYGLKIRAFFESSSISYTMISGLELRRSLGISRGKNDNIDAGRIARYCYLYREELKPSVLKSTLLLRIQSLMSERRSYLKRVSQAKAYLTEHKKESLTSTYLRYNSELKHCSSLLREIESEILCVMQEDESLYKNYQLLTSITGIAFVNAVNAILYTNNFTSFSSARAYACFVGVAPFSYSSGTSMNSPARVGLLANRVLNSDLTQAALSAVSHDAELRLYYQRKKESGKSSGSVMNAVKFKLIERMFCVVKRGSPYVKLLQYAS